MAVLKSQLWFALIGCFLLLSACLPGIGQDEKLGEKGRCHGELESLLKNEYLSVNEIEQKFYKLEQALLRLDDPRAIFASVYLYTTREIRKALEQDIFLDNGWMASLLINFANLYREALFRDECGERADLSKAWRLAFDSSRQSDNALLIGILGVSAHINHDLALSLNTVGITQLPERKYLDHTAINTILIKAINDVQNFLAVQYDSGIAELDKSLAFLDERVLQNLVETWREDAWNHALRLSNAQSGLDYDHALALLELSSELKAYELIWFFGRE